MKLALSIAAWSHCLISLIGGLASVAHAQPLHTDERFFRDEQGAVIVLRGLNVAGDAKVPPFRPIDDERLFDRFPDWGVNVARVLFTWEAFEPSRGSYDESYYQYYLKLLDALHGRGVRVIVDIHQDAYARFLMDGCGEGFPEWSVSKNVKKHEPDNGRSCSSWGIKLILDVDMHRAWDDFYADTFGARTAYLALLDTLSRRLAAHPAVIGYDMINEPWADEVSQLAPLHEDGARVIRKNHPGAILFLSPQALTSSGQDTKLPRASFPNFAYAPHYYDAGLVTLSVWAGGSLEGPIARMANQASAWRVPLFLGEFGAPGPASGASSYLDAFYRELDLRFVSATQWAFVAHWNSERKDGWNVEDYSITDERGELRPNYRVRPYPARIGGTPTSFEAMRQPEPVVTLAWTDSGGAGDTRIFAPRDAIFGEEVSAETRGPISCSYEHDLRHVRCTAAEPGEMRVVLRRCGSGQGCLPIMPAPVDKPEEGPGTADSGTGRPPRADAGATPNDSVIHPVGASNDASGKRAAGDAGCSLRHVAIRHQRSAWLILLCIAILRLHHARRRSMSH